MSNLSVHLFDKVSILKQLSALPLLSFVVSLLQTKIFLLLPNLCLS